MRPLRQFLASALVLLVVLGIWARYVPQSQPLLERVGLWPVLADWGVVSPDMAAQADGGAPPARSVRVLGAVVAKGRLNDAITAIGDGRALRSVTLRAEATGRITAVNAEAGSFVSEGTDLVQLDDSAERIAVERARLVLANAGDDLTRAKQLKGTGAVTALRVQEAELVLRTAELALEQAQFDLSRRVVKAPFDGWIGLLDVEVGDRVNAQDQLAVLTDRSHILIEFRVSERLVGRVVQGTGLTATPLAMPDMALPGEISAVDNVVDRTSRTLRVLGRLTNEGDRLRAGMAFSVRMTFTGDPYPAVDPLAVQWSSEGAYVWAVRDDKAVRVPVLIRQRNADTVLVEADLTPGEVVVREGVQSLRPGADVTLAEEPRAALAVQMERQL